MPARSNGGSAAHCPSCEGTGKSHAARAADAVAALPVGQRAAAFQELDVEGRSRLFESNRDLYDALRDGEAGQ